MLDKIKSYPQNGYGVQSKLCRVAGVFTSYMAGVLKGDKQLTPEQAVAVADFFLLSPDETEYFIELVQLERAGSDKLKKYQNAKIEKLREKLSRLQNTAQAEEKELTLEARAIFYSDWRYSAVRNASALPGMTAQKISEFLDLKLEIVHRLAEFLLLNGLIIKEDEVFKIGPTFTRVRSSDPLVYRHHTNWRQRAIDSFAGEDADHMHVTSPLTLSAMDAKVVRDILQKSTEKLLSVVGPSASEELWCINIDWFRVGKKES